MRYSAVTLDLKNNSFHLLLKHSLQATFMITEGRQTCYPHLGISPLTEIIKPILRTAVKWSLSNVWLHRLSEKKV